MLAIVYGSQLRDSTETLIEGVERVAGYDHAKSTRESSQGPRHPLTTAASAEYLRYLYEDVLGWYKIADSKNQVLLTIDGVILSILTGTLLSKRSDLAPILQALGPETWALLLISCGSLLISVASAALCLVSRLHDARIDYFLQQFGVDPENPKTFNFHVLHWFGYLARLGAVIPEDTVRCLRSGDLEFWRDALASHAVQLSQNVLAVLVAYRLVR